MENMSEETIKFLNEGRPTTTGQVIDKQSIVTDSSVIKNPVRPISITVAQMQEQLQLRKLEIEIEKLEKPSTNIDYFQKMLELQQQHFNQMLTMNTQQNEIKLELEKLKIMKSDDGDFFGDIVKGLLPLIPEMLKHKNPSSPVPPTPKQDEKIIEAENVTKQEVPTTLNELEEYKKAIRNGEISFEEAYEDFCTTPYSKLLTKEQFKIKYEEIKNGN